MNHLDIGVPTTVQPAPYEHDLGINDIQLYPTEYKNVEHIINNRSRGIYGREIEEPRIVIPNFVTLTGPTEEYIREAFDRLYRGVETIENWNERVDRRTVQHPYRGYATWEGAKKFIEVNKYTERRPLWYFFSGMTTQQDWRGTFDVLRHLEPFRWSFLKSIEILKPFNDVDISKWLYNGEYSNTFVFTSVLLPTIQIAMVQVLKSLGIEPDGIVGHSCGELVAAYVDGALTHEETLLAAYYKGKCFEALSFPLTKVVLIRLPYEELIKWLQPGLVISHYYEKTLMAVTGPAFEIEKLIRDLQQNGVYVKELKDYHRGLPLHTSYIKLSARVQKCLEQYRFELEKILPRTPRQRTNRWISTSISTQEKPLSVYERELLHTGNYVTNYATAEYFINNLINPVYFYDAIKRMPENAIAIEIGPLDLLKQFLVQRTPVLVHDLTKYVRLDGLWENLYNGLGHLYIEGVDFDWRKFVSFAMLKTPVLKQLQTTNDWVKNQIDEIVVPQLERANLMQKEQEFKTILEKKVDALRQRDIRRNLVDVRFERPIETTLPTTHIVDLKNTVVEPTIINKDMITFSHVGLHSNCSDVEIMKLEPYVSMEFSGITTNAKKRVMGIKPIKSLVPTCDCESKYLWEIPKEWTLEQAATVPYSYATAYYAMLVQGMLKHGDNVLIEDGVSLVGQAAIRIALNYRCQVFVTVESKLEREHIRNLFPQLLDEMIGYYEDPTFEDTIIRLTEGKGVATTISFVPVERNLQYNELYGRFVRIVNPTIPRVAAYKDVTPYHVDIERLLVLANDDFENNSIWLKVHKYIQEGIKRGIVKPLDYRVFDRLKFEDAVRHMTTECNVKPLYKVVIKVNPEVERVVVDKIMTPIVTRKQPITAFSPLFTYVLVNGTTEGGLELVRWMAEHGARNFLLTMPSTRGKYGIRRVIEDSKWKRLEREFANLVLRIAVYDVRREVECVEMLKEATELSVEKQIGGVFYLNNPYIFENEEEEDYWFLQRQQPEVKYRSIYNLDKLTRDMVHVYFVVLSPMKQIVETPRRHEFEFEDTQLWATIERLCELRRLNGRHALCMQTWLLVNSIDKQDLRIRKFFDEFQLALFKLDTIARVPVPTTVLTTVPVVTKTTPKKQLLTQERFINLLEDLQKLETKFRSIPRTTTTTTTVKVPLVKLPVVNRSISPLPKTTSTYGIYTMPQTRSSYNLMPKTVFEKLNDVDSAVSGLPPVFIIHPIEGHVNMLKTIAKHIKYPVYGIQFTQDAFKYDTIEELGDYYWSSIIKEFPTFDKVHLTGYGFGAFVAFEMATSRPAMVLTLSFLDDTYKFMPKPEFYSSLHRPDVMITEWLMQFISQYGEVRNPQRLRAIMAELEFRTDECVRFAVRELLATSRFKFDPIDIELAAKAFLRKMEMAYAYEPALHMMKLPNILHVAPVQVLKEQDLDRYSKYFGGRFIYKPIDCDKREFLESSNGFEAAQYLNEHFATPRFY